MGRAVMEREMDGALEADSSSPGSPGPSSDTPTGGPAYEAVRGAERFDAFRTVDWIQDSLDERHRRLAAAQDEKLLHHHSPTAWLLRLYNAAQSWIVVALVGAAIGINAAIISIVTEWASDLKMGFCRQGWWLNQKFCCWEIEAGVRGAGQAQLGGASGVLGAGTTEEGCDDWVPWTHFTLFRWVAYLLASIGLAYAAAKMVRAFAPLAAGSGISEIKCIISGFDAPGYLSLETLGIKSIALPLAIASGLSVGKEGPSVHVAACIGNVVASCFERFSRSRAKMREVVTAASAAGVAVVRSTFDAFPLPTLITSSQAFGSPVGGVLFAFEVRPLVCLLTTAPDVAPGNDGHVPHQDDVAQLLLRLDRHRDAFGGPSCSPPGSED